MSLNRPSYGTTDCELSECRSAHAGLTQNAPDLDHAVGNRVFSPMKESNASLAGEYPVPVIERFPAQQAEKPVSMLSSIIDTLQQNPLFQHCLREQLHLTTPDLNRLCDCCLSCVETSSHLPSLIDQLVDETLQVCGVCRQLSNGDTD